MAEVIIIVLISYLAGSFISAILLKISAKWVQNFDLTIGKSYKIMLVINIINVVLGIVILAILAIIGIADYLPIRIDGPTAISIASILMGPVGFLVQSKLLSSRLKIAFSRGCLISFAMTGIVIGVLFAIRIVIFAAA